ncbi:signal recognition particle protein [Melioribacter roseus P3M-2]|jgi:signal recognition particle subunit SRP54|uniref:Signal recognition particle protein n=1 Tax=Melioribacter roseus (strain DSM 23840 / JCM 17771 / VKM B-2668 / P3M-2) TaxID=1191523 RepID=I6ZNE1_MELRP|nr:signal recognition particle protein [Melioribacter roseus]AFN73514.1 signal recognition particle protein [Melioribacter roseus P3M-2]
MLEELTEKFERVLKKVTGQGRLTEENISETLREIRRVLLDADVNYKVAKQFIEDVKVKALGKEVLTSITPGQLITKIIYDELTRLLGGNGAEIKLNPSGITTIMLIGLQGCGKTTFSAKLARLLKSKKRDVLLVAADVYRPAAVNQLKILGKQIDVPVFSIDDSKDPVKIAEDALEYARQNKLNTVIIDTAGRLHIDEEMMREAAAIKAKVNPTETLFVVDSMTGQDAVNSAKAFHEKVDFDGIVITKLDGDSRGGCVLSIRAVVDRPVKFVSAGEKLDSIEVFYPDRLASRILGKGDIVSLVEKAQQQVDEKEAEELQKKLMANKFDFDDFLKQIKMLKKMGSLKSIISMIPGVGSAIKNADIDDKQLVKVESIIQSMTKEERRNPKILNGSRRKRIARGSGNTIQDVNRLIKQFNEMQKMIKMINKQSGGRGMLNLKKFGLN